MTNKKPREWWIASIPDEEEGDRESMVTTYGPYAEGYDNIHVIEKSHYDLLERKLKRAMDALKFYSYKDNWFLNQNGSDIGCWDYFDETKCGMDLGDKALKAIKEIEAMK